MDGDISFEDYQRVVDFHGHRCPGLAIGIRVSELCLRKLGHNNDSALVTVCETDMCGVDAVQFLTGCTIGKGNLIVQNHGKMAFSFFRRRDGRGFRALLNDDTTGLNTDRMFELMGKIQDGTASPDEIRESARLRSKKEQMFLKAKLDDLFIVSNPLTDIPKAARVMRSIVCECCHEKTMEARIHRFAERFLCQPCFLAAGGRE